MVLLYMLTPYHSFLVIRMLCGTSLKAYCNIILRYTAFASFPCGKL